MPGPSSPKRRGSALAAAGARAGGGASGGYGGLEVRAGTGHGLAALPLHAAEELTLLERELGGRQALVSALTYAPLTRDTRYVLGLLGDPEHRSLPLAEVCRMGKILPGQLIDALAKGTELRSRLLASQAIAQRTPAVVREVMWKAAEYEDDCTACQGTGSTTAEPSDAEPNPAPAPCAVCQGFGRLRFDADPRCRELALDMAGLTSKGGPLVQVAQQVNVPGGGGGGSFDGSLGAFELLQEALDKVLYGGPGGSPGGGGGSPTSADPVVLDAEVLAPASSPEDDPAPDDAETPDATD